MLQNDAAPAAGADSSAATGLRTQSPAHAGGSHVIDRSRLAPFRLVTLSADDRTALGLWAAAHLALLALAWAAAWAFRATREHAPLTGAFEHWDAALLRNIAQYGYFGPHTIPNNTAFFPGYPAALAVGHLILRNWVLSEIVVSGVAGCFAVVALARLAGGSRAVLYLLTSVAAVFLMVGYAEVLFLAFAIPAWHAAARGRWWRAALFAALAGLVRPDAHLHDSRTGRHGAVRLPRAGDVAAGRCHDRRAGGQRRQGLLRAGRSRRVRRIPMAAHRERYGVVGCPAQGLGPALVDPVPGPADYLVGRIPARLRREHRV